jgi:hypothetical protein
MEEYRDRKDDLPFPPPPIALIIALERHVPAKV